MSDDVTNGITKQLRHVLFRSKSDRPPSAACKRGIDAEPILLGRILKKGLSVYDPLTKTRVHATLRNEEFQTLLIPGDNATIAATTDMTADAFTPDGQRCICRIAVEVKYLNTIAPVYDQVPEKYRLQIQAQIRASGTKKNPGVTMFYVQGHAAEEVGNWGSTCSLTILEIKPDFKVHDWIDFNCRLGQILHRKFDPELFDQPMLTRRATVLDDTIKRTTFSKCVDKCGGTAGSFRYLDHEKLPVGSKFLSIPGLPRKCLVIIGKIDPNHPTHKKIMCDEYRKVDFSEEDLIKMLLDTADFDKTPTQIAKTYKCSLQQSKNALAKAKKIDAQRNFDELKFLANSALASKGHTLENAVARLHKEKGNNAVSLMCYMEAPETDPDAVDPQALRWFILTIDGKSYDITNLTRTASQMDGSWSFAEHSVFGDGEDHGTPFGLRPMTGFSDITVTPGHVLRADNLFWALRAEVMLSVGSLERWCWDATFGVSKGSFAYLGATTSDAENGTVSILHGLIRRQDEDTFRVYMEVFAPLVFGIALRRHVVTCTDGCPRLTMISENLLHTPCHSDSHWHQRCRWHAVNQDYTKLYGAHHGHHDDGVGQEVLGRITDLVETVEDCSSFERQYTELVDWIHSEKPTPTRCDPSPTKSKKKSRYISSFSAVYGEVDDLGIGDGLIRVHWKGKPHEQHRYDTLMSAQGLITILELPLYKVFFNARQQEDSEIANLPSLAFETCALDSLVTSLVDRLEPVAVLASRQIGGVGEVLRVGWNNLPRLYDTWEVRHNLVTAFDDAEDTILCLEKEFQTKMDVSPGCFDNLPSPLTPFDVEDAASKGFNPSRRQALFTYLQGVYKIRHKLALCYRPRIYTGDESTSAKGERRWGVFKYANCASNLGTKEKALSKQTNTEKVAKVTMARAERTMVERLSRSMSKVRKAEYTKGIPSTVAMLLTNRAVTRVELQLGSISHYDITSCDCGEHRSWILRSTKTGTKYTVCTDNANMLTCTCAYAAHNGAPCRHMLAIVVGVLGGSVSTETFHPRWWNCMYQAPKTLRGVLWDVDGYFSESNVKLDDGSRYFRLPSISESLLELEVCDGTCGNTPETANEPDANNESDDDTLHDDNNDNNDSNDDNANHDDNHPSCSVKTQTEIFKEFEQSVASIKQLLSGHPEVGVLLPKLMTETLRQLNDAVHTTRTFETEGNTVMYGGRQVSEGSNDKRIRQAFEGTSRKKRGKRRRLEHKPPHNFNDWLSD